MNQSQQLSENSELNPTGLNDPNNEEYCEDDDEEQEDDNIQEYNSSQNQEQQGTEEADVNHTDEAMNQNQIDMIRKIIPAL